MSSLDHARRNRAATLEALAREIAYLRAEAARLSVARFFAQARERELEAEQFRRQLRELAV